MSGPKVFIIGGGQVATVLARALNEVGVSVLGLWARRQQAASEAALRAGVPGFSELPALLPQADCVILAVTDASVSEVARMLVHGNHLSSRTVLLHCAGSQSSAEAFAGLEASVAGVGLLHPLRAIASSDLQTPLTGTFFGIEGDDVGRRMAEGLCTALGGRALRLRAEEMASYHAAAALASNYVVALLDLASQLLGKTGVGAELGLEALTALAHGALANLRDKGLPDALTGPIRRGDRQTIERHLVAIASQLPAGLELYREAALWSVPIAARLGDASKEQLSEIIEVLGHGNQAEEG